MIPKGLAATIRLALDPVALLRAVFDVRVLRAGWKALRPFSLVIAASSCVLGAVLAFRDGSRDWINAAAAILAGVCLQAGVNLVNDFSERTMEGGTSVGSRMSLLERDSVEWMIFCAGLLVMAAAGPIGLLIAIRTGWPIIIIGLVGFAGGYFYTGEPINYKRRGLGPLIVFFLMGVLMISGTYYAVRGAFTWRVVPSSVPLGILISLILLANELRDRERDGRCGVRTMTVRIGYRRAVVVFFALLASAYASAALLRAFGLMPHLRLLFLAAPFAVPPSLLIFADPARRRPIIPLIMLHHLVFGSFFALTFVLS